VEKLSGNFSQIGAPYRDTDSRRWRMRLSEQSKPEQGKPPPLNTSAFFSFGDTSGGFLMREILLSSNVYWVILSTGAGQLL
jgi:hypothetical protein